jgi:hypothetical protein
MFAYRSCSSQVASLNKLISYGPAEITTMGLGFLDMLEWTGTWLLVDPDKLRTLAAAINQLVIKTEHA